MDFEIIVYKKENGEIPLRNFLDSVEPKMRAKLYELIGILQEKGNMLREPYSKHLQDGIFELRCKCGSNITRIYYQDFVFFLLWKQNRDHKWLCKKVIQNTKKATANSEK